MMNSTIKNIVFISLTAASLSASGADVSEQIAGVKWDKNEYRLIRFHNNEMQECRKIQGELSSTSNYEIDGNILTLKQGSRVVRGTIEVTGKGDQRILILKNKDNENHFKIDNSELCIEIEERAAQDAALVDPVSPNEGLSVKIDGIKWERISFGNQFFRFKNGEAQKCFASEGVWKTESPYSRKGNKLIFSGGNSILVSVAKGNDGQMVLSFDNNAAYQTTQSESCPME